VTLGAGGARPVQIVASTLVGASIGSTNAAILTRWRAYWDVASQAGVVVGVGKNFVTSACIGSRAVATAAIARAGN
jgi:hypothetical protein